MYDSYSCYLDGHEVVDTGTLRSACRHCDAQAEWDRATVSWQITRRT